MTGGGSGGHVYPLIAVAEEIRKAVEAAHQKLEISYFGPDETYAKAFTELGITEVHIAGPKLRRYFSLQNFLDVPKFFVALAQSWWKLFWLMPDVVFSKGGPGALPVILSAWFYRIPIIIHESDSLPGLTNALSSIFASRIAVSFSGTATLFSPGKVVTTGNPIRGLIVNAPAVAPDVAKRELGFESGRPLMLVLGGSQGSKHINEFITLNLAQLLSRVQILHQTGMDHFLEIQKLTRTALITGEGSAEQNRYKPVPYLEKEFPMALTAADIVVGRSGSGAIFEIAAFGKPAVLIPHRGGNGHQRENAYAFAKNGAAIVIEESNLLPGIFLNQIDEILNDTTVRETMSRASRSFAKPQAAQLVAEEILKLIIGSEQ